MTAAVREFDAANSLALAAQSAVHAGQVSRGIRLYRAALNRCPHHIGALNNLGLALTFTGYSEEAAHFFKQASLLQPGTPQLWGSYLSTILYAFGDKPDASKAHLQVGAQLAGGKRRRPGCRSSGKRLNIGYLAHTFAITPERFFLFPILRNHDRSKFRVYCYSDVREPDSYTAAFENLADTWRDVSRLDNESAAARIRQDRVDILVDTGGHFNAARLGLFSEDTGAVHVSYPMYPCTTGLPTVDARIGSWATDPEGAESFMSEKLIRLDGEFACYEPPEPIPALSPLPCACRGHITFGSFNRLHKLSDRLLELWATILLRVPGSRMLFHHAYPMQRDLPASVRRRIVRVMNAKGIEDSRLRFAGQRPIYQHLRVLSQADIALDAFPYNGTATTCESLLMGVPVVTQAGQFLVSRVGLALLNAVGLHDCVTTSAEAYIEAAVSLAGDRSRLAELRSELRDRFLNSAFGQTGEYTASLERAYLAILGQS